MSGGSDNGDAANGGDGIIDVGPPNPPRNEARTRLSGPDPPLNQSAQTRFRAPTDRRQV